MLSGGRKRAGGSPGSWVRRGAGLEPREARAARRTQAIKVQPTSTSLQFPTVCVGLSAD